MPLRPASTANTAGLGNPFLSLGEDAAALVLTIGAFALPLVALLLVLSLLAAVSAARRLSRARQRPSEIPGGGDEPEVGCLRPPPHDRNSSNRLPSFSAVV